MKRAVLLLCLPLTASGAQIEFTRTQLCERAHSIVVGELTDIETRPSADGSLERWVHLTVSETLKGAAISDVTVTAPGGTLNGMSVWVEHSPVFSTEAKYLLFLEAPDTSASADSAPTYTVVADEQGTVRLTPEGALVGETLESAMLSIEACRAK